MRIYKDRLYTVKGTRFINRLAGHAHQEPFEAVVLGKFVRSRYSTRDVANTWHPDNREYRVDDGHLPDHQPRVNGEALKAFMTQHGLIEAVPVQGDPILKRLAIASGNHPYEDGG